MTDRERTPLPDDALESRIASLLNHAIATGVTPGAVCEITRSDGRTVSVAAGRLAAYGPDGKPVSSDHSEHVARDSIYDLASVTKVFTAITILSLVDAGVLDLDRSIAEWLPTYGSGGRRAVTLSHLLSHTAGLSAVWPRSWHQYVRDEGTDHALWTHPVRSDLLDETVALPLAFEPGSTMEYSCLGYITAMTIAERATGRGWAELVTERVLTPLGLRETTFTPAIERTAPTEFQPELGRGMVRGIVHDENAYALGGVSGNAGLFAPAGDLTVLGRALLAGLPGILSESTAEPLWQDQLPRLVGSCAPAIEEKIGFGQSLGLRIGQKSWMGERGYDARGHTGFTGTSVAVDRHEGLVIVLLTNRVHPNRERSDSAPLRRAVSDLAYTA